MLSLPKHFYRFVVTAHFLSLNAVCLMRHDDLPERWKNKLREYLIAEGQAKHATLGASDFPENTTVRIRFEDDSKVEFRYAFVIEAPEFRQVAVFTEHCGYHLFQSYEGLDLVVEVNPDASASV